MKVVEKWKKGGNMLTQEQKQILVDAMMVQAKEIEEPHCVAEMAECAWNDVELMEPFLVDMLDQAEARGRLQGILETLNPSTCAPAPAKVKCQDCDKPASFITYGAAHCFEHRPVVA